MSVVAAKQINRLKLGTLAKGTKTHSSICKSLLLQHDLIFRCFSGNIFLLRYLLDGIFPHFTRIIHVLFQPIDVIKEMRGQRAGAVQTEGQYVYLHKTLLEYINAKKIAKEKISEFFNVYKIYQKKAI